MLRFRDDGTFTIVQFADMHIHDDEETNRLTLALVEKVLDEVQPDLVVLTGDTIFGSESKSPGEAAQPRQIYTAAGSGLFPYSFA